MSVARKPTLLVLEFWGLGDLTFATPLLRAASEKYDITLVGKAHAQPLLAPSFPGVRFITFEAPWSAYREKYALWKWHWRELIGLISELRAGHFDVAVSVRNDPRDHLFMWLIGARQRFGFPLRGSSAFLTHPLLRTRAKQHKVEDWRDLGLALGLDAMQTSEPQLARSASPKTGEWFDKIAKPVVCLHPGARIPVRRWPEEYFRHVIGRMRAEFDFHLILIPDLDGYGRALAPLADTVLKPLQIEELVDVLGRVDLLICNDSGPGHIAAACGRPTIVVFGPTDPDWFRPWGDRHFLVIRDICPWRPCFDYCKFEEPYCMTKTLPDKVWPEIREQIHALIARGLVPATLASK